MKLILRFIVIFFDTVCWFGRGYREVGVRWGFFLGCIGEEKGVCVDFLVLIFVFNFLLDVFGYFVVY